MMMTEEEREKKARKHARMLHILLPGITCHLFPRGNKLLTFCEE